jgi:hypothetical protein
MEKDDVDGIFDDFEHKVEGRGVHHESKKEAPKKHEKELSPTEILKNKYEKAEQVLKHKYNKEKEALEGKKNKGEHGSQTLHRVPTNIERIAYVAVIIVLVAYAGVDLVFNHGNTSVEEEDIITAAAVNQEAITEKAAEEVVEELAEETVEEPVEEVVTLSGKITLTLDKVHTEVSDNQEDTGIISKIDFTIDNGKETALSPIVEVYIYDNIMHESWEQNSRGQYTGTKIKSGGKLSGTIILSPKTYKNLDVKKSIRVSLDDLEEGFITSVNDQITIS